MAERFILIDKNTSFNGSIEAEQVVVEGNVEGDIIASDKVLVKNGGMVNGTIDTDEILFEEGGKHEGLIRLGEPLAKDKEDKNPQNPSAQTESDEQHQKEDVDITSEEKTVKKENPQRLW